MTDHWQVIEDALTSRKKEMTHLQTLGFNTQETRAKYDELIASVDAALAFVREQRTPQPNNVPLYTNEQIDDIVDNYIFLNNGTSTYRVWEDRANKYLRELRDKYEQEIAFWQKYGVTKNLRVLELEAELTPQVQQGGRWEPLPDGFYLDGVLAIAYDGKDIGLKVSDEDYGDDWAGNYEWLSDCEIRDMRAKDDNLRLCRWQEGGEDAP